MLATRSTPGLASWLMNSTAVPRERVGPSGRVIGVDRRIEGVTQTLAATLGGDHA